MNEKTCLNCGNTFTPKRSDALCCSANCRSTLNYKKKQRKNSNIHAPTISEEAQDWAKDVIVKGELDTKFLIDKTKECETKIERINDEINQIEILQKALYTQIPELEKQILTIEIGNKAELLKRKNLSDVTLYNNYLNSAYLNEKKKVDSFAQIRLKSESDIENKHNPYLRVEIESYRSKIDTLINKDDLEIASFQRKIESVNKSISQNSEKIKDLKFQLRFYEARILRYENMLLSV